MIELLRKRVHRVIDSRPPDFVIGGADNPYMLRWWVIPRNRWFNIYAHMILRPDDDRALHDHPWPSLSIVLQGSYIENFRGDDFRVHRVGDFAFRSALTAHRLELFSRPDFDGGVEYRPALTLFITGPRVRDWGFHCPKGWIPWQQFTAPGDSGQVGKGCDE